MIAGNSQTQRGISLVEALVSLFIFSIAILGLLEMHAVSIRHHNKAYMRTIAITQAQDIIERMRANRAAFIAGSYNNPGANQHTNCNTSGCTPQDMAEQDFYEWNQQNATLLPGGSGTVTTTATNATITLNWQESGSTASASVNVRLN